MLKIRTFKINVLALKIMIGAQEFCPCIAFFQIGNFLYYFCKGIFLGKGILYGFNPRAKKSLQLVYIIWRLWNTKTINIKIIVFIQFNKQSPIWLKQYFINTSVAYNTKVKVNSGVPLCQVFSSNGVLLKMLRKNIFLSWQFSNRKYQRTIIYLHDLISTNLPEKLPFHLHYYMNFLD